MRSLTKYVLVATPFGLFACASVWGFEDAKERTDADTPTPDAGGIVAEGEVTPSNVAGIFCAPRPPEGWLGPLSIRAATGSPPPELEACPDRWEAPYDTKADLSTQGVGCGCNCDPAGIKECQSPTAAFFEDDQCTTPCKAAQVVPSQPAGQCLPVDSTGCTNRFAKVTAAVPGGSCAASSKGPPGAAVWGKAVRLCKPKADQKADCAGDKVIAPETALPYDTNNYCIVSRTLSECPKTYPNKSTTYERFNDSRSCEPCGCGAPVGGCGGVIQAGDTATGGCGGGKTLVNPPATCATMDPGNKGWGYWHADAGPTNPSCSPDGGAVLGKIEPADSLTVCCRQ